VTLDLAPPAANAVTGSGDIIDEALGTAVIATATARGEKAVMAMANISVVAGHFYWDAWLQLPSFIEADPSLSAQGTASLTETSDHAHNEVHTTGLSPPPCLVMGRHPVDRAISYYYQRCYQSSDCVGFNRRINDLTVDELHFIALSERQGKMKEDNVTIMIIDEGMSDAACRTMANEKATTGRIVGTDDIRIPDALSMEAQQRALQNVEMCVVGLIERWDDTLSVVEHWFPWISFEKDKQRRKMHIYSGKETEATIRGDLREVLVGVNQCDMALYAKMTEIFQTEMKVLATEAFR
jgi:hypothetical protein